MMRAAALAVAIGGGVWAAPSPADLLTRLRAGAGPQTSQALHALVRDTIDHPTGDGDLAGDIMTAWNAGRRPPPVDVSDLEAIFSAKRDAVRRFEVEYATTSTASDGADRSWWTRWTQGPDRAERCTASARNGLRDAAADPTAMRWVRERGRVWFGRMDEPLTSAAGASMLGLEDSWLGAGGCIGDRRSGLARASEHDLGSLLGRLPFGVAIVESAPMTLEGVDCVVLRVGWEWPCWVYLDPALDFAPRRIDRVMDLAGQATLSRTNLRDFVRRGGLWIPTRIAWRQHPLSSNDFGPGDVAEAAPDWVLTSTATRLVVNGESWSARGQAGP
ncbi:MAG: hypothetical protein QF733_02335 [Phycisphaerales bacterium]|jgi:hypothetical protein|nr:hypothetical protein [Phycisphaerales bacterium]